MTRWLLVLAIACSKREAPPASEPPAPQMSAAEIQRSQDACKAYVDKACACAAQNPAAKDACDLSRALPDAVRIGVEVAASPETKRDDVLAAQSSVRKTVKECIEQLAKLPCQ